MKKLDISKDLSKRKYHRPLFIVKLFYRVILSGFVYRKFQSHIIRKDDIRKEKGACFVLFNHLSRLDHYYVYKSCFPKRVNMVAGCNEFYRSHLHFVFKCDQCIPKKNYTNDMLTIKAIFKLLKQNACIAMAPEALASNDGTNKPIVPGLGHLLKKCKVPVYIIKNEGSYLQNTKVCMDLRIGPTYSTLYKAFSVDDLANLTVEEIENKINDAFRHDEYAWNKEHHFKYDTKGRVCENLDDLWFKCPKCGKYFTMVGKGNEIKCTSCGNSATQDDYYDFTPSEGSVIPSTVSEWVHKERIDIIKTIRRNKDFTFSEKCKIGALPNDRYMKNYKTSEIVSDGVITIDHSGVHFKGSDPKYDFDLTYKDIYTTITVTDSTNLNFYVKGEYRDMFPEHRNRALYMNMLIEEMHRLHENYYKNFKWNDYMYDEKNWD